MAKEFVLRGVKHGGGVVEMAGPEVPLARQQAIFDDLINKFPVNEEFAEVGLFELVPHRRKVRFMTSKAAKAQAAVTEEANKKADESRKAEAARAAKVQGELKAKALKEHQAKVAALNKLHDSVRASSQGK